MSVSSARTVDLAWNWLCLPYIACAIALVAVGVVAATVRGDRVLRLGTIGTSTTALPWAVTSALAACTGDPELATQLYRLGNGPIALVGPSLMLVLLGVSGQLERYRVLAWTAGSMGTAFLALCWGTDWIIPGVRLLPSGIYYVAGGPLTPIHYTQLGGWLILGLVIARRAAAQGPSVASRRRMMRTLVGVLALGAIGSTDLLLVYDIAGVYPIAWAPALLAAVLAVRAELTTDLLRPQGFDRGAFVEVVAFLIATVLIATVAFVLEGAAPVALAALGAVLWVSATAVSWLVVRDQPVRVARERALEELAASLTDVEREETIAERLGNLWRASQIELRALWRVEGDQLISVGTGATRALDPAVAEWLVDRADVVAVGDLGTTRLGSLRERLEAFVAASGTTLVIPLVDRAALVGLADADHSDALRDDEAGFVIESARAVARALTYIGLARAAAREGETAREVEVAEAMRMQASASRDDELGRWIVAAEYRTAPRTTGAAWSSNLLPDGRLALLVTEAQAHGVAAALATAALTGAFAAATTSARSISLDDLLACLAASAEGVMRGGEPVAAFVAIVDAETQTMAWACAGHPGGAIVEHVAHEGVAFADGSVNARRAQVALLGGGGERPGASLAVAQRGQHAFGSDSMLVVASSATRLDDARYHARIQEQAHAGSRLATLLVDAAARQGQPSEDLLAVVVRQRLDRPSVQALRRT